MNLFCGVDYPFTNNKQMTVIIMIVDFFKRGSLNFPFVITNITIR
jgi:hypothetical protein